MASSLTANPFGPPRPCAISTILTSPKNLVSTQTLLYSIQKTKSNNVQKATRTSSSNEVVVYEPEVIVLVTPNISNETCEDLRCFCTRIIRITKSDSDNNIHIDDNDDKRQEEITKIQLLNRCDYDQLLYIDCNCIVFKNLSHLFQLHKTNNHSDDCRKNGLISAAIGNNYDYKSKGIGSDYFDTDVMLVKPCHDCYNNMVDHVRQNDSDSNIWNTYFHNIWIQIPKDKRLGMEYYYRFVNNQTGEENNKFNNAYIMNRHNIGEKLYQRWQSKSQLFKENYKEEQILLQKAKNDSHVKQKKHSQQQLLQSTTSSSTSASKKKELEKHKLVSKRYKELRKMGINPKESMRKARSDFGMDKEDENEALPSAKVASMFGLGSML